MANQKTRIKNLVAKKMIDQDITAITGSVTLGSGDIVDLNGEADALVLDADGNTSISAPTDNQIDIEVNGADDFTITANTLTALSGSKIATNTIDETTAGSGVTIDGLLIKDGIVGTNPVISGDGAITIANSTVYLTKGSAAAITIAAPTAGTHDGLEIWVIAGSAQAHVITCSTVGFNAKGSSGTVTYTAAIGNAVVLKAYNGNWYTPVKTGVTVA